MRTAIIVPCWNGSAYIGRCLESVLAMPQRPEQVLVVDDNSTDDSLAMINACEEHARQVGVRLDVICNDQNLGFTKTANIGLRTIIDDARNYDLALLINQDATVHSGWLAALCALFAQQPDAGAAGCKIFYPDGLTLQHAGGYLVRPRMLGLHFGHHAPDAAEFDAQREVDFVTGAAIALRTASLRQVGIFDEVFSPGYYEDVDLCVRLRENGWRTLYCPDAVASHVESASFSGWIKRLTLSHRNRIIFTLRWMNTLGFEQAFASAEQGYLRNLATLDELKALAVAYGRVLLMLPEAFQSRLPACLADRDRQYDLIQMLAELRAAALAAMRAT
jgi:GT2 family glycosyltransferase